jgi:hypothetical protein
LYQLRQITSQNYPVSLAFCEAKKALRKLFRSVSTPVTGMEAESHLPSIRSSSVSLAIFFLAKKNCLTEHLGLSVFPTWLAVREHTPVETDKNWGSDEEQTGPELLDDGDKNKLAVAESAAR